MFKEWHCYTGASGMSGIVIAFRVEGGDGSVLFGADFDVHLRAGFVACHDVFLIAGQHEFDRTVGSLCHSGSKNSEGFGTEFAAEPAAHILRDAAGFIIRYTEGFSHRTGDAPDSLSGVVDGQFIIVPFGDTAMRFETVVNLNLSGIGTFVDDLRFLKPFFDVTVIAGAGTIDIPTFLNAWRFIPGSFFGINNEGEFAVLDLDFADGILRLLGVSQRGSDKPAGAAAVSPSILSKSSTACTPGIFSASLTSILWIRACA